MRTWHPSTWVTTTALNESRLDAAVVLADADTPRDILKQVAAALGNDLGLLHDQVTVSVTQIGRAHV